jgi:hypothetical protein
MTFIIRTIVRIFNAGILNVSSYYVSFCGMSWRHYTTLGSPIHKKVFSSGFKLLHGPISKNIHNFKP